MTQTTMNLSRDKQNVIYPYNVILFNMKKSLYIDMLYNTEKS